MHEEEVVDCMMEVDKILDEVETALESRKYQHAMDKVREARDAIEDLRQDDCADDAPEIGSKLMNRLK